MSNVKKLYSAILKLKRWVESIDLVDFTEEEKSMIMGENALRFVGREDLLTGA